jgi:hypothetical protein
MSAYEYIKNYFSIITNARKDIKYFKPRPKCQGKENSTVVASSIYQTKRKRLSSETVILLIAHNGLTQERLWIDFIKKDFSIGILIYVDPEYRNLYIGTYIEPYIITMPEYPSEYGDIIPQNLILFACCLEIYQNCKHAFIVPGNSVPIKPHSWFKKTRTKSMVCFEEASILRKEINNLNENLDIKLLDLNCTQFIQYSMNFLILKEHMEFMIENATELLQPYSGSYDLENGKVHIHPDEFAIWTLFFRKYCKGSPTVFYNNIYDQWEWVILS